MLFPRSGPGLKPTAYANQRHEELDELDEADKGATEAHTENTAHVRQVVSFLKKRLRWGKDHYKHKTDMPQICVNSPPAEHTAAMWQHLGHDVIKSLLLQFKLLHLVWCFVISKLMFIV